MGIGISSYLVIDWVPNYRVICHPSCFLRRVAPSMFPCSLNLNFEHPKVVLVKEWVGGSNLKRQAFNPRLMGNEIPGKDTECHGQPSTELCSNVNLTI